MTGRPTIAVAVHDGFYGCGTGAGYANFGFLETLISLLPSEIDLAILPVRLAPDSAEYHPGWCDRVEAVLAGRDISVYPVDNGTGGQNRWGTLDSFRHCSAHTAEIIEREIFPRTNRLLVLAFDVPFFGIPALIPSSARQHVILVPRSTGMLHTPLDTERADWERVNLRAGLASGTRIGAISPYMRRHLRNDYGIPPSALREFTDGLCADDWRRLTGSSDDIDIALPGEFLFTMGRAEPYKGFEDLLDAIAILRDSLDVVPPLVFAATAESPQPTEYQRYLTAHITRLDIRSTILYRFTPAVPRILTHPGVRAVIIPSRAEPFGRVPMEAFAAGAGPVVATTAHGLSGQVIDGVTGFTCEPGAPTSLASAMSRALALDIRERAAMLRQARAHALREYDHQTVVRGILAEITPEPMFARS